MLPLSAHQCQEKPSVLPRFSSQCVQILISLTENYTAREDEVRFIPCDKTKKTSRTDSCVGLRKLKIGLVYLRISMINCILQHLYTLKQCCPLVKMRWVHFVEGFLLWPQQLNIFLKTFNNSTYFTPLKSIF